MKESGSVRNAGETWRGKPIVSRGFYALATHAILPLPLPASVDVLHAADTNEIYDLKNIKKSALIGYESFRIPRLPSACHYSRPVDPFGPQNESPIANKSEHIG
jgi:hypothetical protein